MTKSALFSDLTAALDRAVSQPFEGARGLPPAAYTDDAYYELEREHLFRRGWQCVGRVDQIPNKGDYLSVDLSGTPVIVVRGKDQSIKAMANVCQHRSARLLEEGAGNTPKIVCPYHAWTYELSGELTGIPIAEAYSHVDRGTCGLPELRHEVWLGFIFVNVSGTAEPLAPQLQPLADAIAPWNVENVKVFHSFWRRNLPWNWKVMVENFTENYHLFKGHAESFEPIYPTRSTWRKVSGEAFDSLSLRLNDLGFEMAKSATGPNRAMPHLTDDQIREGHVICVFPHHLFAVGNSHVGWLRVVPTSAHTIDLHLTVCLPADQADALAGDEAAHAQVGDTLMMVQLEDETLCDAVQRGLESGFGVSAPISTYDPVSWTMARWMGERMREAVHP